jgi:outer membrane protein assembly factor BamA
MVIFVVNQSMALNIVLNRFFRIVLLSLCMLTIAENSEAQYQLKTLPYGGSIDSTYLPKGKVDSELEANELCNRALIKIQLLGYAGCRLDSISSNKKTFEAHMFIGPRLEWGRVSRGNVPEELLRALNYPKDSFEGDAFHPATYLKLLEKLLEFYENTGYPFVSVKLDDIKLENQHISASLFLDKGKKIVFDTLDIRGNSNLKKSFLYSYLGFKAGSLYDESVMKDLDKKIQKLPFVTLQSPSKVFFLHDKAHVVLNLKKKNTDRIDGIVGLAPNSQQTEKGDLLLTGEVNINLHNLMGSAKAFDLKWKSFGSQSQELKLATNLPYLFSKPFGIDGFADIYKYDTFTINVRTGLGIQYLFQGTNYFRVYYENSLSILQTVDTVALRNTEAIPNTNPINIKTYGLDFLLEQVDYIFNPSKGFKVKLKVGIGSKTIEKDTRIEQVSFFDREGKTYNLYDSIDLKLITGIASYDLAYFIPLGEKAVLVPSVRGKHIVSSKIFFDELFRIGGNGDLRGFDERSIPASTYHIYQMEYRYLISRNSYFSGFFNGAYYQNISEGFDVSGTPIGFGIGLNLEVKTGVLNLAYALGKEKGNPIQLNQSKIHFGIVSFL